MKIRSAAFTLVELLIVISLVAVLAALCLAAFGRAQARSQTTRCASNLRQLGISALLYASDHDMTLPVTSHQASTGGKSWTLTLQEYAGGKLVFRCPTDPHPTRSYSYVLNDLLTPNPSGVGDPSFDYSQTVRIAHPAQTVLFAEAVKTYASSDHFHFSDYHGTPLPPEVFANEVDVERHNGSANYLFADGHVETLPWPQVRARLAQPGTRFTDPSAE